MTNFPDKLPKPTIGLISDNQINLTKIRNKKFSKKLTTNRPKKNFRKDMKLMTNLVDKHLLTKIQRRN